tara:strand:+ start:47 stop:298 length:252 start_codon:yes stop_codon:yes gene_type:complete
MPDFEALIRHQQLKNPTADKRLKLINKESSKIKYINDESTLKSTFNWKILSYFFIGFLGGLIGSITILFIELNKIINFDLLKI